MTLEVQFLTMLHMTGAGIYLGLSYATYSRLSQAKQPLLQALQDLLFWLINGLLVFMWLKAVNDGEIRIYIFLSLFLGFAMYKALLESLYLRSLEGIISFFLAAVRFGKQLGHMLLIRPIVFLYQMIVLILAFSAGLVWKVAILIGRVVYFPLRPLGSGTMRLLVSMKNAVFGPAKNKSIDSSEKRGIWRRMANWWKRDES